jgi:hypothetical protein
VADSIDVTVTTAPITVTVDDGTTVLVGAGTVGPAGPKGDAGTNGTNGQGVPTGGTTGQVLAKASGTNYDTEWVDQSGGGGGSGTVTSVTGTAPISVATGTTTPVVSIAAATTSAAGSMSAADKAKLDGVASGATANSSDATLLARANHTGTQALSTISDAGTAAAKNAPATGNAAAGEVVLGSDTRLSDSRTPSTHAASHGSAGSDPITVAQSQVTNLTTDLAGKVPTSRTVNGKALSADVTLTASDLSLATIATTGSASDLSTGTVPSARLGTGTASANTFLRGDQTYQPVPAGNNDLGRVSNACYLTGSGLSLNGATSGNYAATPDATALDITGDLELVVRVAPTSWANGASQTFIAKRQAAGQASYWLAIGATGIPSLSTSADGTTILSSTATASTTTVFSSGQAGWLKVTFDVDNGASGRTATFYWAADQSTEPSSWTQLGAAVTTAGTTSIFNSTSQLEIGSNLLGSSPTVGTIYQAIVRSGIAGSATTVFDADFTTATADALTFTPATGGTITITTTRYAYGIPNGQMASQTTLPATINTVYYAPFEVTAPLTLDAMAFNINTAPATGGNVRMGVYAADANLQPTGAPLFDSGDVAITTSTTGTVLKQGTAVTLQPGVYLTAFNTGTAVTLRVPMGGIATITTTMGSSMFVGTMSVAQTQGAFPSPGTAWTTRNGSNAGTAHPVVMRWRSA